MPVMAVALLLSAAVLVVLTLAYSGYRLLKLPNLPRSAVKSFAEKGRRGPIAHRGTQPENTLAGIRRSKELGASGVEVDVQFTNDGYPVLIHDDTVERTASHGVGEVGDMTLQELKKLDVGSKFGSEFAEERVPTLEEAISLCEELDLQIYLEFKGSTLKEAKQIADTVKRLFAGSSSLYDRVAVISFWPIVIHAVRKANPGVMCGLSIEHGLLVDYPNVTEWWKHFFFHKPFDLLFWSVDTWLWRLLGVSMLMADKRDILSGRCDVAKWKSRGVDIVAWTVNDEEEQRYFRNILQIPYMTDIIRV